ncbi:3-oxoacyl-ACP reductase FabG [Catenovulum sp. 2E275]|uniref:3-oxoacyl-ACP reductase FabG n=1 Tax=Catenovulum sp. 2E275 TaxID=2980497 RepID=UPI0021D0A7C8|nr:3-oxoacyl-ACP reductase FabG [Catenovulum sp. 2E275]MCU4676647.1 3-oxoacyl-ACP reductase FabG [Catenovulum sp. 2E275]
MNKRVLVTGSSKGIGQAIALKLAKDGFDVTVHCRSGVEQALATVEQIKTLGQNSYMLQFDVANRAQTKQVLEQDVAENGCYYGVVCNAGITQDTAFPAMTENEWDSVIHTNLDGFYNVLHPLVMPMVSARKGGRIVTLSSVSGVVGNRGQVNYSASKAGIIGATKALSLELAKRKITVNCVAPGLIDTGMTDDLPLDEMLKMIPLRRAGQAKEVAAAVAFLMSEDAGYITRQVISVNGGIA